MDKIFKIGITLIVLAVILNVLETAYFGFNMHAMSKNEERWDVYCKLLYNIGISLVIVTLLYKVYTHKEKP
jgi:heme/copper-type cytochrome/quinol oxidase subunit 4